MILPKSPHLLKPLSFLIWVGYGIAQWLTHLAPGKMEGKFPSNITTWGPKPKKGLKINDSYRKQRRVPLRRALGKMHLFSKAPLIKIEYVTNTQCERRESLAFNTQPTLQSDVAGMWIRGPGLLQTLSKVGLKATRVHGLVPCLFMCLAMLKGMGHLGIHGIRLNWAHESRGEGGRVDGCVLCKCNEYLQVAHYKHTHRPTHVGRRKQIFLASDSLELSFGLVHAQGPSGLFGIQKVLLLFPGRKVQWDLRLLWISEDEELFARV